MGSFGFKVKPKGFTLNELLIMLSIIGVIATFLVPKIIQDVEAQEDKVKLKDTLTLLEQVAQTAYREGAWGELRWNYFTNRINATKLCPNGGLADGCQVAFGSHAPSYTEAAFQLPNGVVVGGININSPTTWSRFYPSNNVQYDNWIIDANGTEGPNEIGKDILAMTAPGFTPTGGRNPLCDSGQKLLCPLGPTSITMYNNLYK